MLSWHIWAILAVGCINLAIGLRSQLSYAGGLGFTLDDAFIHLGVAKSLTDDGVWGINGKFVSVSTSPLWTLLITPLHLAFGYYPLIFHLLSAVFAVGTAVMIYLLIKESLRKPSLGVISGVAYLVFPLSIWATVSGLEIHLTNFLFVLALFLFFKNTHPFLSGLVSGLCGLARPENFILSLIIFLFLLYAKRERKCAIRFIYGFFTTFLPYIAFNLASHGQIFPTPSYAKTYLRRVGFFACFAQSDVITCLKNSLFLDSFKQIDHFLDYMERDFFWLLLFIGGVLFGLRKDTNPVMRISAFYVVGVLVALGVVAPSVKMANYFGRYFSIFLPSFYILGAYLASLAGLNIWLLAGVTVLTFLLNLEKTKFSIGASTESTITLYVKMPRWVADNVPRDSLIAANDIGGLAYFTENRIIDLMGLASPEIWELKRKMFWYYKDPQLGDKIKQVLRQYKSEYAVLNLKPYRFAKTDPCFELLSKWHEKYEHGRLISPIGVFRFKCIE